MVPPIKTKILILGPQQSGKTTIANYLADTGESRVRDYRPTQGVRIVEFESNDLELHGQRLDAEVELWDCGGDIRFEKCWPAIRANCDGVILVCNPEPTHAAQLHTWYNEFVVRGSPKETIILLHEKNETTNDSAIAEFRSIQRLPIVPCNIERDGDSLRLEFTNFLCSVILKS